ncbi:hypothetical protein [Butyrivibrio sp. AD3002]|uniref:hypothetical protein n=1 Tax=Butyrivibrio sp. AD3002 TaxID=1280670 RepID=UPI0003B45496|nr:hypothetical protein [Butyrivibrio sp. AD3002]
MKNPGIVLSLIVVTTVLSMNGCSSARKSDTTQVDTRIDAQSDAEQESDVRTTVKEEDSAPSKMPETENNLDEEPTEENLVYGNGSYFVKVGDKVYFHDYSRAAVGESSQGGQFLYLGSGICAYDESTGEINEISGEPCSGKLFFIGDGFYTTSEDETGQLYIVRVSMDGDVFNVGPGNVEGISEDGTLIALWSDDSSLKHLDVLDDSSVQYCRIDKPEDGTLSFCGLTDKEIIYEKTESDEIKLCSMDTDNKEVSLGTLSDLGIFGSLECDDFLYDKESGDVFCLFAHYGGPVDSIEDYLVVKASPGREDSLELISHGYDNELMPNLSYNDEPSLRLNGGELSYGFFDSNELYLSHSYLGSHMLSRFVYGNLLWSDDKGQERTIIKNFIPNMDKDHLVMQTGEVLGDDAYILVAEVQRDSDNDQKLSQAFKYENIYVMKVPMKENSGVEVISGGDFESSITFDKKGYEPYIGNWRMDDFIIEDGYEPAHSRNMWVGITDEQELSFIDNEEYSGFPFILSTSKIGDECLIVGYNEVLGLTCTGRLSEDDGEQKLILEVQEKMESIDDPGPSSWKGSFHRVSDEEWATEW